MQRVYVPYSSLDQYYQGKRRNHVRQYTFIYFLLVVYGAEPVVVTIVYHCQLMLGKVELRQDILLLKVRDGYDAPALL